MQVAMFRSRLPAGQSADHTEDQHRRRQSRPARRARRGPQWSPPLTGGTTDAQLPAELLAGAATMEPAAAGGTTHTCCRNTRRRDLAAMEPAACGRDDGQEGMPDAAARLAAMEPAAYGRD